MKDIIADEPKNEKAASSAVETIVIQTACRCGDPISVELNRFDCTRRDGKRPFYPDAKLPEELDPDKYSMDNATRFRCRNCEGYLADTCKEAAVV